MYMYVRSARWPTRIVIGLCGVLSSGSGKPSAKNADDYFPVTKQAVYVGLILQTRKCRRYILPITKLYKHQGEQVPSIQQDIELCQEL